MTVIDKSTIPKGLTVVRRFYAFIGFMCLFFIVSLPASMGFDNRPWEKVRMEMIYLGVISVIAFVIYFGIKKLQKHGLYLGIIVSGGSFLGILWNYIFNIKVFSIVYTIVVFLFLFSTIYLCLPKSRAWFSK